MNGSRHAVKVGAFVLLGLALLLGLVLLLNKGAGWFTRSYELRIRATSLSGLQEGSLVLMSGVRIGEVAGAQFGPEGKGVIITLRIREGYTIHSDARFVIEQLGLLGDQYVSIYPRNNHAPALKPGELVKVEEPFNLQETVRSATGLLEEIKQTAQALNEMAARVNRTVLSEQSLTNGTVMIANFRETSERTLSLVDRVDRLVSSNSQPISAGVSNLVQFIEQVQGLAAELQQTVATNRAELSQAMKSLDRTAQVLEQVAMSIDAGQGVAGALVNDQALKGTLERTLQNLETATSNITRYGLLYKPKQPKKSVATPALPPKNPRE